jgi:uncharacterized membrane protein
LLAGPVSVRAQAGDYVVLQPPGCQYAVAWGVNDRGDVVGNAWGCAGELGEFAFLYRGGAFSAIDVPGAAVTIPTDINDHGVVVGYFRNTDNELGAFTFWRGEHQTISVPGMPLVPQGINNRGDITGWLASVPYQAFLLTAAGNFTILDLAGDWQGLKAWKINSSGLVVGGGYTASGVPVPFMYRHGQSTVGDLPGGYIAVNDRGDLAAEVPGSGYIVYRKGTVLDLNHPEASYTVFDLSNQWAVGALSDGRGYMLRLR